LETVIYLGCDEGSKVFGMEKVKDRVFKGERISLDFSEYDHCLFENCEIHVEYGMTRLIENEFRNCSLHLHGQATVIAQIIDLFRPKSPAATNP